MYKSLFQFGVADWKKKTMWKSWRKMDRR